MSFSGEIRITRTHRCCVGGNPGGGTISIPISSSTISAPSGSSIVTPAGLWSLPPSLPSVFVSGTTRKLTRRSIPSTRQTRLPCPTKTADSIEGLPVIILPKFPERNHCAGSIFFSEESASSRYRFPEIKVYGCITSVAPSNTWISNGPTSASTSEEHNTTNVINMRCVVIR